MPKSVAVLVRESQGEALRIAAGLTLAAGRVEVFVLDRGVAAAPELQAYLDALRQMGARLATNVAGGADLELLPEAELARRVAACEIILPI